MKQLLKVLALVLVLVLAIGVLVACNDDPTPTPGPDNGGNGDGGNNGDGGEEDEGDEDDEFIVTFMYIDAQGNALPDTGGYTQKETDVDYNGTARHTHTESVTAFAEHVIIGWNTDKAKAMAGEVDADCLKNVKKNKTVYSVVRAKDLKTVVFQYSNGEVFESLELLEGSKIDDSIARPTEMGCYFKEWRFVSNDEEGKRNSTLNCIYGDCTFKAAMGATDGTIGKVATGAITLDARKDPAYDTSGAYLAHNNVKTVNDSLTVTNNGNYAEPDIKADTWMVWDGDYIYLLIEVFDNTLTYRSDAYMKSGADAWCNDAVELWYNFEQDATITTNYTRVGLSAMGDIDTKGDGKYALGRSRHAGSLTGIGFGRSTHFDEIEYETRNYIIAESGEDISDLSTDGDEKPSYIIEFKIPAYTEGEADLEWAYKDWETKQNGGTPTEKLTGTDLEEFKNTGRLYGVDPEINNINSYRFTEGTQLQAGDFVYFSLQINDLKITIDDLNPQAKKYLDMPTEAEAKAFVESLGYTWDATSVDLRPKVGCMLFSFNTVESKLEMASTRGLFCATGSTQSEIKKYLMFSLSGNEEADAKVHGYRFNLADPKTPIMLDADGNIYTRAEIGD